MPELTRPVELIATRALLAIVHGCAVRAVGEGILVSAERVRDRSVSVAQVESPGGHGRSRERRRGARLSWCYGADTFLEVGAMNADESHVRSFQLFVRTIQDAGLIPTTSVLRGHTWQVTVVPRPLRTFQIRCDSSTGRLTVTLRRVWPRRVVLDLIFNADSLEVAITQAVECVMGDPPSHTAR